MMGRDSKNATELEGQLAPLLKQAADEARAGRYPAAARFYDDAWNQLTRAEGGINAIGHDYAFWLLMNCVETQWRAGDSSGALEAAIAAHQHLSGKTFGPVGNPYFHLRVGQCLRTIAEEEEDEPGNAGLDDLARALICGGIEIFEGEDARFLEAVVGVLRPPEDFETWEASRGAYLGTCRDLLGGAFGYVQETLDGKFD